MSDFLDLQGAKDLNTDAIHIGAVANSKDPVTGAPIDTHVNRVGGTDYTLDGLYKALGPVVMPWTSVAGGTLTQPNQAFLHPANGNYYSWTGAYPVGGYVVAPGTDPTVVAGYVPRTDVVFRAEITPSVTEALRRSYAEAGYNLVDGSFETGGTLVNTNDVLLQARTWKAFSGPAGTVAAGTEPTSGGFVDKSTAPDFFDVSIKNFGAVGGGADDTAAIDAALAYHDFVYVPDGVFRSSNNDIEYWRLYGIGKVILPVQAVEISPSPQGRALHKSYKQTYGRFEQAAACSIVANPSDQTYINTQINGTDARGLAQDYPGRDHVGQFIWARGFMPMVTTPANTTYTQSSITAPEIAAHAKPNMIIETVGSNKATAIVTRVEGNTAFCSGWFTATANNVTPPNGIGATINPINKLFGQNIVISPESGPAMYSAGTEYNIFTKGATYNPGVRGVDVSFEPGGGGGDVGVMVRGKRNIAFYSYDSDVGTGAEYGFRSKSDKRGLSIQGATLAPIEVTDASGNFLFGVGIDGSVRTLNIIRTYVNPFQAGVGGFTFSDVVSDPNYGARFTIWGFNTVGGARFRHEVIMNGSGATVIGGIDDTGLGVHYSVSNGRSLVIKTTSGVVQAMASAEYAIDGLT